MNLLPLAKNDRAIAYILCGDERFCRFLENELERLGISAVSVTAIPEQATPPFLTLLDTDHFSIPSPLPPKLLLFGHDTQPAPLSDTPAVYLRRPFSLIAFETAVSRLLEEHDPTDHLPPPPASFLTLHDNHVVIANRSIPLSPAEHSILSCLHRAQGNTVPKDALAPLVGGGNSVEVYVCRLRTKIEKPTGRRLIHTVRGVGYRLDAELFS